MCNSPEMSTLISMIERRQPILFVGAGLSRGSGLLDWEELICSLCEKFKIDHSALANPSVAAHEKGPLLQCLADKIEQQAHSHHVTLDSTINSLFSTCKTKTETVVQERLLETFVGRGGVVFTTNYDNLIETAAKNIGLCVKKYASPNIFEIIGKNLSYVLQATEYRDTLHIFKIHGDISSNADSNNNTLVLSGESYDRVYQHSNLALLAQLADLPVLFVGCSFTDRYLLTAHRENSGNGIWTAFYARAGISQPGDNDIIEKNRIEIIPYKVNDLKNNEEHKSAMIKCFDHIYGVLGYKFPKVIKALADISYIKTDKRFTAVEIHKELSCEDMQFGNIAHLKKVTFSIDYTGDSIPDKAFYKCTSLIEIDLPKTITSIGVSAFEGCKALEKLCNDGYPDCNHRLYNLLSLGRRAFYDCIKLSGKFVFDETCHFTSLPQKIFENCEKLEHIELHAGISEIENDCFNNCANLKIINLPDLENLKHIRLKAFLGCKSLRVTTLPATLETIGSAAFQGCEDLLLVTVSNELKQIGDFCFADCRNLVHLMDFDASKLTEIEHNTFQETSSLKQICLPDSLEKINRDAFLNSGLTDIVFCNGKNKVTIEEDAFRGCHLSCECRKEGI